MMTFNNGRTSPNSSLKEGGFYAGDRLIQMTLVYFNVQRLKSSCLILSVSFLCLYSSLLFAADVSCNVCHAKVAETHASTPHGKADIECKSCHGDGGLHITAPNSSNITTFSAPAIAVVQQQYGVCKDCHINTHDSQPNAHKAAGITCGNCHSTHAETKNPAATKALPSDLKRLTAGSSTCYGCHQDSFAQFEFNERHRLQEGVVECTSCHDPHSPQLGMQLGGFKQSVCSDCHADVAGPFVFEHGASRVEGCAACHEPHGSPNRHMLKIQEVGSLCYSCHADAPQFHLGFSPTAPPRFNESTVCTNCHVTIHGSNLDRTLLR